MPILSSRWQDTQILLSADSERIERSFKDRYMGLKR